MGHRAPGLTTTIEGHSLVGPDGARRQVVLPHAAPNDRGFALIFVIWLTGVLAVLGLSFAGSARVHVRIVENARSNAQAELLAEGGIRLGLMRMLTEASSRSALRPSSHQCLFPGGSRLTLTISDEAGRVDMNLAGKDLILAIIASAGLGPHEAARATDRILQARAAGDNWPAGSRTSAAAGDPALRHISPSAGRFGSIEDVAGAAGLRRDTFDLLRPHLTVHSGIDGIDPNHASPALLRALSVDGTGTGAIPRGFLAASTSQAFLIRAAVVTESGAVAVREAVVSILPERRTLPKSGPDPGFGVRARAPRGSRGDGVVERIWDWRQGGAATEFERAMSTPHAPC